jgi:hypothetical protein
MTQVRTYLTVDTSYLLYPVGSKSKLSLGWDKIKLTLEYSVCNSQVHIIMTTFNFLRWLCSIQIKIVYLDDPGV